MTSETIKAAVPNAENSIEHSKLLWLKEIAYQLAVMNERPPFTPSIDTMSELQKG